MYRARYSASAATPDNSPPEEHWHKRAKGAIVLRGESPLFLPERCLLSRPPVTPKRNASLIPLLTSYVAFIVLGIAAGLLNVAWLSIQDTFQVALDSLGVLLLAGTTGGLLASFFSGPLVTRFGAGRVLLGGSLIGALGTLAFTLSPSWGLLILTNFVAFTGKILMDAVTNTFVAAHYSAGRLNWLHACFGIGTTLGPALVTVIVVDLGLSWRWSYGLVVALDVVLATLYLLTLPRWRLDERAVSPRDAAPLSQGQADRASIRETLAVPMVWLSLALFFAYGGVEIGAGQLTGNLFTEARGIDTKTVGFWISAYWASFTVGRMLLGVVADRLENTTLLRVSMVGAVIGAALLWWNPLAEFGFVGLALMGLSFAGIFPTLISETPRRVGLRHAPNAIGFQLGATSLGISLLPGLAGVLAARFHVAIIAPFLLVVCLIVFLLHEIVLFRERWPRRVAVLP